jgi:DNA-binding transcriptional LysR family regulator
MRELDLDRLRTLVTIADLGSFVAASRALHLAPPTISQHVSELESRLGAGLLLRTRGRVTPTRIGETLVERARRLLADAEAALDDVRRQLDGRGGRVRLGASTGAIAHLLPRALEALGRDHPGIDVQVAVLTSQEAIARVLAGTLDVGLVALPQAAAPRLRIAPWRRDPVRAFVPAAWPRPARATPAWLASCPLIMNDASTRLSRQTAEWFAAAGLRPAPRIELNFNDAIRSLVAAGWGAALLPHEATAPPPDPRIAMLPVRPALWRALGIACRAGTVEPAVARVLAVLGRSREAG